MWADVAISFKSFSDSPKNIENRKILPQILIEIPTVASLPRNDMLFCYCSAKQQFTAAAGTQDEGPARGAGPFGMFFNPDGKAGAGSTG